MTVRLPGSPAFFRISEWSTDVVGAVRAPDGAVIGYLGLSGSWSNGLGDAFPRSSSPTSRICQILDQNGTPLFTNNFVTNQAPVSPEGESLINEIAEQDRPSSNGTAIFIRLARWNRPAG